jgi:peptidoglycan/xylan/chitin deacetylase (PgdA/CDA1 family)
MRLPVLLYHHVGPERPGTIRGLTVSPERFERQVRWLARRGYKGICPADWLRWRREGKGLPEKPILITFDDGYEDLATYALPVLRRYGFGAAVYVVTGQLGGTNVWDETQGWGRLQLMTAEQIRSWAAQGIEFGAHTRTHADLTKLSGPELKDEVVGSGKDLEAVLGARVVSFAYPFGFHNQTVDDCVHDAYDLAFIADDHEEGLNHLQTDPHLLLRTLVRAEDSIAALAWRARWGHSPFQDLRNWINDMRAKAALRTRLKRAAMSGGR